MTVDEPEEIRFDDMTSLTDWAPTDHGVEVTVCNLALWPLGWMECDSDVAQMRVRIGPGRSPLVHMQRESSPGEPDVLVMR